jgi:Domain of unknown function (DUF4167)
MRQGQQNRRGRGRNRKGQSPLTRSFESTGPDVKLRGTPAHIAEKYISLARDASSSGDPVLAENYLQHAEHYNRIIMAFRDQNMGPGQDGVNGGARLEPGDEFGDDDGDEGDGQPSMQPLRQNDHQPRMDNQRYEGQRGGNDQHRFRDRNEHRNNRTDRGPDRGPERSGGEQRHYQPPAPQQSADPGVEGAGPQQPSPDNQMRRRERLPQVNHEQPEFLRRPVRRPRREGNGDPNGNAEPDDADRD